MSIVKLLGLINAKLKLNKVCEICESQISKTKFVNYKLKL